MLMRQSALLILLVALLSGPLFSEGARAQPSAQDESSERARDDLHEEMDSSDKKGEKSKSPYQPYWHAGVAFGMAMPIGDLADYFDQGIYLQGRGGYGVPLRFYRPLALEMNITAGWFSFNKDDRKLNLAPMLVGVSLVWKRYSIQPFVGGSMGGSQTSVTVNGETASSFDLSYGGHGGVRLLVSDKPSLFVTLRGEYLHITELSLTGDIVSGQLGVNYKF